VQHEHGQCWVTEGKCGIAGCGCKKWRMRQLEATKGGVTRGWGCWRQLQANVRACGSAEGARLAWQGQAGARALPGGHAGILHLPGGAQ